MPPKARVRSKKKQVVQTREPIHDPPIDTPATTASTIDASDSSSITRDNLTVHILQRLDEIREAHTSLEADQQAQVLSILSGLVSDMNEPTLTPEIKLLPLHIQEEIMKRLPVKSLIQFRSVSKSWRSLIDSSKFIAAHSVRQNLPHHLFVQYNGRQGDEYVSFVDDDSFPRKRFVQTLPPPTYLKPERIVGTSYGLLCLDGNYWGPHEYGKKRMAVIWNPSIRKSIAICGPSMFYAFDSRDIVLGFGVCPVTVDPKIVEITLPPLYSGREFWKFWEVNVYKLSSGKFRKLSSNLPSVSVSVSRDSLHQVVIDRFIYWCADEDCEPVDDGALQIRNLILSFDITNENFKVVDLPDSLATLPPIQLSISKLRESLVMLEYNEKHDSCAVWKMDHGVQRLFTKLFTIKWNDSIWALGFRKMGGPIMAVQDYIFYQSSQLVVYEPISENCNDLIWGDTRSFSVHSYMETLLLLGRSDCTSYDINGGRSYMETQLSFYLSAIF